MLHPRISLKGGPRTHMEHQRLNVGMIVNHVRKGRVIRQVRVVEIFDAETDEPAVADVVAVNGPRAGMEYTAPIGMLEEI